VTGTQILLVAIPLVLIQLTLLLIAAVDLLQEERQVRGGNKIVWVLVIVFVNIIGPLIYFFFGREEGRGTEIGGVTAPSTAAIAQVLGSWPRLAPGSPAAIETSGLSKRYGRVVALEGLDLSVPSGSVFGFLGPNGAGKTTTIRLVTGLASATSGTGTVAGVRIGGLGGQLARHIGYLDQDPRFYGWMTGRELLELVGRLHGLHRDELRRRVGDVLEIVGLGEAAERKIGGYSGGMRQRLGIGQALLNRPEVLFLDEPVSSLDPEGRRDILAIIDRLRGTSTVFLSTHILSDVERVCDRVAILNVGHLVVQGPIDELLDRYARPVYELQPEPQQPGAIERLANTARAAPWVSDIQTTPDTVRVFVSDPKQAGAALLPMIAQTGVALVRYERVRPSLEDVFMRLVAERPELSVAPKIDIPVTGLDGRGRE
jgi:ABC-2 type transport system ATP-binding protein